MRWFEAGAGRKGDAEPTLDGPRKANFKSVTNPRGRAPSWLPAARGRGKKDERLSARPPAEASVRPPPQVSLRPPPLPSEFVDAIRQELEPERLSRPPRASEMPARVPSLPPAAALPALAGDGSPTVDAEATAAFMEAVELLVRERSRLLEQTAIELGELATIIARRVIAHEISLNPMVVAGLVNEGLAALGAHDRVLVRVGPAFETALDSLRTRLADRSARAEVRVDESLPLFGCIVETELGRVDESVETRIATLLQALRPDSDSDSEPFEVR